MNLLKNLSAATAGTAFTPTRTVSTVPAQTLSHGSQKRSSSWAKRIGGVALMGLSLSLLASGKAAAISFTFEKIVDTNTPIPGGTGTFGGFEFPSLDNGNVAFQGFSVDGQRGIYTNIGGALNVVADRNTPIPGGTGTLRIFNSPSLDNGNVAFRGFGARLAQEGLYTNTGGVLNVVADRNTPIPGGTGTFGRFGAPSLDNGNVAFNGLSADLAQKGIYTNIGGALNVVADTNTPIPGGTGTFGRFGAPSLDNGNVAFTGFGGANFEQIGVYTNIGGALNVVADTNTPIPGGTGTFGSFNPLSLDNGNVAFQASTADFDQNGVPSQVGIYTNIGGVLNVVADKNTPIPGGTGTFGGFDFFNGLSLDDGNVAFTGLNTDFEQSGIYTNIGGALVEVTAIGNLLDGKSVASVSFGEEGLSGNQIAFSAIFDDGSSGVYVATVPEPSSMLGTLAFSAFGAGWMLKRRLRRQLKARGAGDRAKLRVPFHTRSKSVTTYEVHNPQEIVEDPNKWASKRQKLAG